MSLQAKDFQRATAERILQIYKEGRRRVLLADEVGLGKTLVAKEVIGLVRQWHRDELHDDFFKVIYICSNANIADQNIEKLGVANRQNISESRLSMQHLNIFQQNVKTRQEGKMQESIIALTPSTSFQFHSALGTAKERALMYEILRHLSVFMPHTDSLSEFLRCDVMSWAWNTENYQRQIEECGKEYLEAMLHQLHEKLSVELTEKMLHALRKGYDSRIRSEVINTLRRIFAEISIDMLDPDLVIMDEFQRFNTLLQSNDDEQSMLARRFFDDGRSDTKILLLSATPYKPYTTLEELNTDGIDEHFRDFMQVMDFLFVSKDKMEPFRRTWQQYSAALKRADASDFASLIAAKSEAEEALYRVMCRTERIDQNIKADVVDVTVMPDDILSYVHCRRLMDRLSEEQPDVELGHLPIEYVKSAPYLLSFMDRYELKRRIVEAWLQSDVAKNLPTSKLLLSKRDINNYRPIPPAHGKLKYLHDLFFGERHEKHSHLLLWVPASNPYYKAGGLFESKEARSFSKVLLFSSWEMVPRMISVMMSYYAERYTFGELKTQAQDGEQKKQAQELCYFSQKKKNRLRNDSLLEYPCAALADLYAPEAYYGWKLSDIKKALKPKIKQKLEDLAAANKLAKRRRSSAKHILTLMKMLDGERVDNVEELYVPANAVDVMTNIAIASPAVCAYRQSHDAEDARKVGVAVASIFNKPESAAIIDLIYKKKSDEDYYESVLDYCVKGNLQSVLDEYVHTQQTKCLGVSVEEAVIATSNLGVDTTDTIGDEERNVMRCHFAIPFIDKSVTDKSASRTSNIRKAFNSPFRPFLLSTTSIGQEGLDFHLYARKIVHWNLPSNPIDLEQREGRINRFKCLAVRRNVVALYASDRYQTWDEIFDAAGRELKCDNSDLVPYWCLPIHQLSEEQRDRLQYIERIVPLYPLSRDRYRYEKLKKVLSLYRMTLGQPRQEELLQLLQEKHLSDVQQKELTIDLCPFNKAKEKPKNAMNRHRF